MHWWLYLYLLGQCPVEIPGHFETLAECRAAGDKAVQDFKNIHKHAPAFAWCVQGGRADTN